VLLDRAWGKPRQDMRIQRVDDFDEMFEEQLRELVRLRACELARAGANRRAGVKSKLRKAVAEDQSSKQLH
jgi:hypothetical protein